MNNINEVLEKELKNIKEMRAENRKKTRKNKYSNHAIKCLYNTHAITKNGHNRPLINHIILADEVYREIVLLLGNSEFILNRSYLIKYISYKTNMSTPTVYTKLDELKELDVVEYIDESVRVTRLAIRKIFLTGIKTINYKKDSKSRSKLKINMYDKGYTIAKQKQVSELVNRNLEKEKVIILNDKEILLLHKELDRGIQHLIYEINKEMNFDRFRRQGIDLCTLTGDEKDKLWIEIEKIYVITKRMEGHKITVKTEILKDVIDFNEHNNKKNTELK